ncbi:hypothetical protein AB0C81_33495 [Streptomyces roseoverticillatus]|uniref:hypothetical protein n=1 Tax=Streptomyces roseoverticillatus TaxID=66429 RepID=UPI0033D35E04
MEKQNGSAPQKISLMASGELRDALTAIEEGKGPAAIAALMAIDSASWQAIEHRLKAVIGTDLRSLLLHTVESAATLALD